MTKLPDIPNHDEMENLFVNNDKLDRISTYLNRFNPIRTMRMERMEIRHSAILSWLLDPSETHGFGDRFLKVFLAEALRGQSLMGSPTAIEVSQSDLRDAEVRREWQNIDIFILSRVNNWAFVIENKFLSSQREGQLSEYIAKVKSVFEAQGETLIVRGVFLTLLDEDPEDPSYVPIRYSAICEFLPRLLVQESQSLTQEVTVFLNHYLEIIRDETGMSEEQNEMERLARDLYRSHKKVLDFVMEHGASTDFILAVESLIGEGKDYLAIVSVGQNRYMYSDCNSYMYSFLPESWFSALGKDTYDWPGCEEWWAGYPLICWIQLIEGNDGTKGQLRLFAEVGPLSNHKFRSDLIDTIKSIAEQKSLKNIRFQAGAANEGKKYSKFLKNNSMEVKDIRDADEIANTMKELLNRFEPCFQAIAEALPQFKKFGKS